MQSKAFFFSHVHNYVYIYTWRWTLNELLPFNKGTYEDVSQQTPEKKNKYELYIKKY